VVDEQARAPESGESSNPEQGTESSSESGTEPEQEPERESGTEPEQEPVMTQVRLRRAPRYRAFVLTGGLIGVLAAAIIAFSTIFPVHQDRSAQTVFLYFALAFALIGGLLGAGAAIFVERRR
jgi:hypothetical protein